MDARRCAWVIAGIVVLTSAARAGGFDLEPRTPTGIKPGTVIADRPPVGWTHLIVKNQPYVETDEAEKVLPVAAELAGSLFAAIVANVVRDPTAQGAPFQLAEVAAGVGTPIDGQDVIVTSETQKDLGANLGFLARTVLSRTEEQAKLLRQVARGPNCAVVDAPTLLHLNGVHRRLVTRYCLIVDPRNGRLTTFSWLLEPADDETCRLLEQPLVRLANNLVHRYPLIIDEEQVTAGVPNNKTFAMGTVAEGARLDWPAAVRGAAHQTRFTPQTLVTIQNELARLVAIPGRTK